MKALTFNTWHGLNGKGLWRFGELETAKHRVLRYQLQERELLDLDADILFLQELNPVGSRLKQIARSLGLDGIFVSEQRGLKVGSFGLPMNLNNGLGVLARKNLSLKKIKSIKLSGFPGFVGQFFSLQLTEFRFALFAEVRTPSRGRLLLCCTHLHHGFEMTPGFEERLQRSVREGVLTTEEFEKMAFALLASRTRREKEVHRILDELADLKVNYDGVLLAGDFNSTPEGSIYKLMIDAGYTDLQEAAFSEMAKKKPGQKLNVKALPETDHRLRPTWDPRSNTSHAIDQFSSSDHLKSRKEIEFEFKDGGGEVASDGDQIEMPSSEEHFEFPIPSFGRAEVYRLLQDQDMVPRRIDFIFASGSAASGLRHCDLWGTTARNGVFLSDHFGVLAEWNEEWIRD